MAYLIRKIRTTIWPNGKARIFSGLDSLPADTITKELKTEDNKLSWWLINDISEIDELGASIISSFDLKTNDFVLLALPLDEIKDKFDIEHSPKDAKTAISKFNNNHYNIISLTYGKLGELCTIIAQNTSLENNKLLYKIKTKNAIKRLKELYESGDVEAELLGKYGKKELGIETKTDKKIYRYESKIEKLKGNKK